MIGLDVLQEWLARNENKKSKEEAVAQIRTFIEMLSAEDEEQSDSDSDY